MLDNVCILHIFIVG